MRPGAFLLIALAASLNAMATASAEAPLDDSDAFPRAYPDLTWEPAPFVPTADSEARYIDYAGGSDANSGSRESPWKHHPWDPNATHRAARATGVFTYIFKQGVTYHGTLVARESGTSDRPIRLTIDPEWGSGKATLAGSQPLDGVWRRCEAVESDKLPTHSRDRTWCLVTKLARAPQRLFARLPEGLVRIPLARTPNWTITHPYDPRSEWYEVQDSRVELSLNATSTQGFAVGDRIYPDKHTGSPGQVTAVEAGRLTVEIDADDHALYRENARISNGRATTSLSTPPEHTPPVHRLTDARHLNTPAAENYTGATLWIEPRRLPIPLATTVMRHDPSESRLTARFEMNPRTGPVARSRYFLEGLPAFLDSPGEYAYAHMDRSSFLLYLRLPGDIDPNDITLEASTHTTLVHIEDKRHIEMAGLEFRSTNQVEPETPAALEAPLHASAIQIRGNSSHIDIHHCAFTMLPAGIVAYPADNGRTSTLDRLRVSDSTFRDIDGTAIAFGNGHHRKKFADTSSRLVHVDILRNRLENIGLLALGQRGDIASSTNAIMVHGGEVVEIAHNHANTVGGSGIHLTLGAEYSRGQVEYPFLRGLIHHNKVVDTLLAGYDFGGISAWTGGPVYIYNNISGNPVGYLHTSTRDDPDIDTLQRTSYGMGIYLDGVYKAYVFNNIVWGLSNDLTKPIYNAAAFNEATGFMHTVFNNTFYKFGAGLHRGGGIQHNRNYYLGNILLDMSHKFIEHKSTIDSTEYTTLAFKNNVFHGTPKSFGQLGKGKHDTEFASLEQWKASLERNDALEHETGTVAESVVVADYLKHDFRLRANSVAIGKGVKVFVPWALSRVVGEWHFYPSQNRPVYVIGENINMNAEWIDRPMFHHIPRNDLECPLSNLEDFSHGSLENWTTGALKFDGIRQFCLIRNDILTSGFSWSTNSRNGTSSGKISPISRDTVDIHNQDFIIESVLKVKPGFLQGGIAGKRSENGYELFIDIQGRIGITLDDGNASYTISSANPINDGQWHHVIVEADITRRGSANIYVDGALANGLEVGTLSPGGSLSNTADFEIGRSHHHGYFGGEIDFLRISKETLDKAGTTIEDLYEWQFNGPFLRDFLNAPNSNTRMNAGAVETIHFTKD